MIKRAERLKQADVEGAVAMAIADEAHRISELEHNMLAFVAGGAGDTPPGQGPTMGMIEPQPSSGTVSH